MIQPRRVLKCKQRPMVLEYLVFDGTDASAKHIIEWANYGVRRAGDQLKVHHSSGADVWMNPGDVILKRPWGEFEVMHQATFDLLFDVVDPDTRSASDEWKERVAAEHRAVVKGVR